MSVVTAIYRPLSAVVLLRHVRVNAAMDCKILGPSSARIDTALRALVNEEPVGLYVGS